MATVSDQKTLDCPLCFNTFVTPRVLPCSHTFCEKCLGAHIGSQKSGGSEFNCPLCAAPTVPPNPNLTVDVWASGFPLNALICSVASGTGPGDLSEKNNDCEPCENGGQIINAEVWCVDCQEKLCSSCLGWHKRMKQLKHHSTVPIEEIKHYAQPDINFDLECVLHRDKIKLFCVDHRKLCCAVCVATDHRQCKDVRSIDTIARDQSQQLTSNYPSIIRDIGKLKTEMEKILIVKKNNAAKVQQEKEKILHDMDARIDRIITHLNELRNKFRNETDELHKGIESSILKNEKNVQGFITNVGNSMEILEVLKTGGTPQQKFTTFENIRCNIATHYQNLKSQLEDEVEVHLITHVSQVLDNIEGSLTSLGSVDVKSQSTASSRDVMQNIHKMMKLLNSRTKISTEMSAAQVKKQDLLTSPLTLAKVVTRSELGCSSWFTGGTYLADGRRVMVDRSSKRLVQLNEKYTYAKEYKLDGKPTDVAAGNKNNEIYIGVETTLRDYIYKCTLRNDLTIISRISAPFDIWGIAVNGDNIIVGTRNAVVILTQDGSTVRSIPKSVGDQYTYVAVSQTQRKIYHRDADVIVCRTWEGQEVFRYQHQQLKEPRGIHTDRNGNVYVCGKDSRNVHLISSDGKRGRILQLQNISQPYFIMSHPQKHELLVTLGLDDVNIVFEIYKLK